MESVFYLILFLVVPTAAVVWFMVSLVRFVRTPKSDPKRRSRGSMALVSGIVMGLVITAVIAITALLLIFMNAIVHM